MRGSNEQLATARHDPTHTGGKRVKPRTGWQTVLEHGKGRVAESGVERDDGEPSAERRARARTTHVSAMCLIPCVLLCTVVSTARFESSGVASRSLARDEDWLLSAPHATRGGKANY